MRRASLLLAFALAACGQTSTETGQDPSSGEGGDNATQPTVQQAQPENLMDDANNEAVPLDPPPPDPNTTPRPGASPAALQAFPTAFQGRWGLGAADCEPGRADAKGLMEVGPRSLRFYESRGTATRLAQSAPGRIEATLAFAGEGMEWTAVQPLTLQQGGRVLIREERDPPATLRYTKCTETR